MKHSQTIPPRPAEFGNGVTTEYRGFTITDKFYVKQFGEFISLQQAKNYIDTSLAMKKLQDKGAALTKLWGACELENGEARREREAEQINNHFENELYER